MQSFSHKAEVARAQLAKACSAAAQIVRTVGKPKRIARLSWGALATSARCCMARRRKKNKCGMAGNLNLPYAFTYVPNLFLLGVWNYNLKPL
jgi:hypothetical protein